MVKAIRDTSNGDLEELEALIKQIDARTERCRTLYDGLTAKAKCRFHRGLLKVHRNELLSHFLQTSLTVETETGMSNLTRIKAIAATLGVSLALIGLHTHVHHVVGGLIGTV